MWSEQAVSLLLTTLASSKIYFPQFILFSLLLFYFPIIRAPLFMSLMFTNRAFCCDLFSIFFFYYHLANELQTEAIPLYTYNSVVHIHKYKLHKVNSNVTLYCWAMLFSVWRVKIASPFSQPNHIVNIRCRRLTC